MRVILINKELFFEDKGQDFLSFIINKNGKIIDCQPFQSWFWVGKFIYPNCKIGEYPAFFGTKESPVHLNSRLNYKIIKIEVKK